MATDVTIDRLRMSQGDEIRTVNGPDGEEPTNAFIKSLNYKMYQLEKAKIAPQILPDPIPIAPIIQ